MATENFIIKKVASMMANGKAIKCMAMESCIIAMEILLMKDNGLKTSLMDWVRCITISQQC